MYLAFFFFLCGYQWISIFGLRLMLKKMAVSSEVSCNVEPDTLSTRLVLHCVSTYWRNSHLGRSFTHVLFYFQHTLMAGERFPYWIPSVLSRFIIQCKKKIPLVNIVIHFFRKICESWDCGNAFFLNSSFCLKDRLFIIGNNYCQSPLNGFGKMFPNLNSRLNNRSGSFKMIFIRKRSRRWRGEERGLKDLFYVSWLPICVLTQDFMVVVQAGSGPMVLLSQCPSCWDHTWEPLCPFLFQHLIRATALCLPSRQPSNSGTL